MRGKELNKFFLPLLLSLSIFYAPPPSPLSLLGENISLLAECDGKKPGVYTLFLPQIDLTGQQKGPPALILQ